MKNESAYIKKFTALLNKVLKAHAAEPPEAMEPVHQIVMGYLNWNATRKQAETAYNKLITTMVDLNDIRVSFPSELVDAVGEKYPKVEERVARMRDALQEVYMHEHGMDMASFEKKTKKDVRTFLDSLPGMTPFVAAQVMLLCYGAHCMPVDDKLADLLRKAGAVDEHATPAEIAAFIERRVKAGDGPAAHAALQAWVDAGSKRVKVGSAKPATKKAARKKTAGTTKKKKAAKKSAAKKKTIKKKK